MAELTANDKSVVELTANGRSVVGVVRIHEELSASTIDEFRKNVATLLTPGQRVKDFVVDMSDVDMVDSTGIGALLSLVSKIRDFGGDVKIAALQTGPKRIFEIIRAHRHFEIFENLDSAVNSY